MEISWEFGRQLVLPNLGRAIKNASKYFRKTTWRSKDQGQVMEKVVINPKYQQQQIVLRVKSDL